MLIEKFIGYMARKKNENYLNFLPGVSYSLPDRRTDDIPLLLYIHVPFCEELCPYCSFHRIVFREDLTRAYFKALRKEVIMYKDQGYDFKALYVGGGTPTVLIDELSATIELIRKTYEVTEVSVETNPNHLNDRNMAILKGVGVNRLSVGVQSFNDSLLKAVERYHKYGSAGEIAEKLAFWQGYFDTLNVDMIFNFPTQTKEMLTQDLSVLLKLRGGPDYLLSPHGIGCDEKRDGKKARHCQVWPGKGLLHNDHGGPRTGLPREHGMVFFEKRCHD